MEVVSRFECVQKYVVAIVTYALSMCMCINIDHMCDFGVCGSDVYIQQKCVIII